MTSRSVNPELLDAQVLCQMVDARDGHADHVLRLGSSAANQRKQQDQDDLPDKAAHEGT
ncbi:hypothetical protein [Rubrivivax gelatinosus]|uniref:hypothetical protein n=1 Tax=Rubrivivax gelatinosus TaxID=28068 RepID=UPI001F5BC2F6|nr:hypothetical protein [Rubrivivax gelatinosus]